MTINLKFIWAEMKWPAATSNYMVWVTTSLNILLENNIDSKIIVDGYTLVGDCTYVKSLFMAMPLKGRRSGHKDAYNFYLLQLRITIKRAFGVLVHRWAILHAPLIIPLAKVGPLVEALLRLHIFCIDQNELSVFDVPKINKSNLAGNVEISQLFGNASDAEIVDLDVHGHPVSLLGHGHHFADAEKHRHLPKEGMPMDEMIRSVKENGLTPPRAK